MESPTSPCVVCSAFHTASGQCQCLLNTLQVPDKDCCNLVTLVGHLQHDYLVRLYKCSGLGCHDLGCYGNRHWRMNQRKSPSEFKQTILMEKYWVFIWLCWLYVLSSQSSFNLRSGLEDSGGVQISDNVAIAWQLEMLYCALCLNADEFVCAVSSSSTVSVEGDSQHCTTLKKRH